MQLDTGQIIQNRYRVVKPIARGGFGAVYRAWDTNLRRPCALKINLEISQEAQKQFQREATLLANLRHPNLARVTDYFILPGQGQYLIMDFVEGEDLQEMVNRGGPLDESHVLPWIGQICDALTYLHTQNPPIIHRDIKPANIKITPDGQVILVDFGIAKIYDPGSATTLGARAVTPGFSPPEQYGYGRTDARSDVYALGATTYTILTAKIPIESILVTDINPQPPPSMINPGVSPAVNQSIMRAINLRPEDRYQTITQLKSDLQKSRQIPFFATPQFRQPIQPTVIPPHQQVQGSQPVSGFPWKYLLIGAILLVLVILAGTFGVYLGTTLLTFGTTPTLTQQIYTNTPGSNYIVEITSEMPPVETISIPQSTDSPAATTMVAEAETAAISQTPTDTSTPTLTFTPSITPSPTNTPLPTNTPTATRPFPPLPEGIAGYNLAFASNHSGTFNIWLAEADRATSGIELPLPVGYQKAWWPSFCRDRLAAEIGHTADSEEDQWIYWLYPDGSPPQRLSALPGSEAADSLGVPRCSHDARYMGYNADSGRWQLVIADLSNSSVAAKFIPQSGNYTGYVSWNVWNDGFVYNDQIVGEKDYNIMLAGFSGSARDITPDQMDSGETIQRAIYPAFSPDGTKVAFTCFGSERVYRLCVTEVGSYRATVIYRDIGPKEEYPLGSPVWSADGSWIYFSAKDGDDWDIFRIKPTGGGAQNLTSSWSSDEITPSIP